VTAKQAEKEVLETLHVLVRAVANSLPEEIDVQPDGILQRNPVRLEMEHLSHKVRVARYIHDDTGPIRIGVFGLFNRGKSMLVNALIGARFMPDSLVPKTDTIVEVSHALDRKVVLHFPNGKRNPRNDLDTPTEVRAAVEKFGTKDGVDGGATEKITITWPLNDSTLMRKGYVLVDTPGAKSAGGVGSTDADTEKALRILEETHVVLFCLNANNLGELEEQMFCEEHVQWLDPLFVINFKDQYDGKKNPVDYVANKMFWIDRRKAIAVSAKDGVDSQNTRPRDEGLWQQSNIPRLEERIEEIIESMSPENVVRYVLATLTLYAGRITRPQFPTVENFIARVNNQSYATAEIRETILRQLSTVWQN
jgi:predicted GTPase